MWRPKEVQAGQQKPRLDLEAMPSTGTEPSEAVGCDDVAVRC